MCQTWRILNLTHCGLFIRNILNNNHNYFYSTIEFSAEIPTVLSSFSLISNVRHLIKFDKNNDQNVINGIQCWTILFVILGHTFMYTSRSPVMNNKRLENIVIEFNTNNVCRKKKFRLSKQSAVTRGNQNIFHTSHKLFVQFHNKKVQTTIFYIYIVYFIECRGCFEQNTKT